ncbi:MAG: hypothetical protein ACTS6P_00260 [Candidatus Hodgkinia cicadicola]
MKMPFGRINSPFWLFIKTALNEMNTFKSFDKYITTAVVVRKLMFNNYQDDLRTPGIKPLHAIWRNVIRDTPKKL